MYLHHIVDLNVMLYRIYHFQIETHLKMIEERKKNLILKYCLPYLHIRVGYNQMYLP